MPATDATGVIHDIGYQRYTGPRLGRRYAAGSLYTHSLRTAFGLGRTAKAKIFPFIVVGLAFLVATIAVAIRSQSHQVVVTYLQFSDAIGIPVLLFIAVVAPELVSRDLRSKILPLYFSRPLRRSDYALTKLAAAVTAVWLLLAGPLLLLFLGGLFAQTGGASGAWHEFTDFLGGLAYAGFYATMFGSLAVLIASWAGRRAVAAGAIVATFLVTAPVVGVLVTIGGDTVREVAPVLNPVSLVQGLRVWIFGGDEPVIGSFGPMYLAVAIALVIGCVTLLLARYRKVAS